eukprot:TRINITY_DN12562_c0_g1_i2.p5 TRINITY_DN12562_c0_g1~~TRINITY_DN12562_c0_g1_i2.p5  ORF type:complete len:127 (+),score=38.13 TRINITY_DN12562_c0_g1_i2:379-759(+)
MLCWMCCEAEPNEKKKEMNALASRMVQQIERNGLDKKETWIPMFVMIGIVVFSKFLFGNPQTHSMFAVVVVFVFTGLWVLALVKRRRGQNLYQELMEGVGVAEPDQMEMGIDEELEMEGLDDDDEV